jgi:hypothetical protein
MVNPSLIDILNAQFINPELPLPGQRKSFYDFMVRYLNVAHTLKFKHGASALVRLLMFRFLGGIRMYMRMHDNLHRHFLSNWAFRLDGIARICLNRYLRCKGGSKNETIVTGLVESGHCPTLHNLALALITGDTKREPKAQGADVVVELYERSGLGVPQSLRWLMQGDAFEIGFGCDFGVKIQNLDEENPVVQYVWFLEGFDEETIMEPLREAAIGGIPDAQYNWACVLYHGSAFVDQDRIAASEFLKLAATQGHADAMYFHHMRKSMSIPEFSLFRR